MYAGMIICLQSECEILYTTKCSLYCLPANFLFGHCTSAQTYTAYYWQLHKTSACRSDFCFTYSSDSLSNRTLFVVGYSSALATWHSTSFIVVTSQVTSLNIIRWFSFFKPLYNPKELGNRSIQIDCIIKRQHMKTPIFHQSEPAQFRTNPNDRTKTNQSNENDQTQKKNRALLRFLSLWLCFWPGDSPPHSTCNDRGCTPRTQPIPAIWF